MPECDFATVLIISPHHMLQFDVACQAADALAHVHALAILHRDISPGNVLRSQLGVAKLADFGLARTCEDTLHVTVATAMQGNVAYMAPEQSDVGRVTDRADVWALAATLLEAWSGEPPYGQLKMRQILRLHVVGTPPSLDIVARPLPDGLRELLAQCLRVDAHARPSAAALYRGLLLARTSKRWSMPPPAPPTAPSDRLHQLQLAQVRVTSTAGGLLVQRIYISACSRSCVVSCTGSSL